MASDHVTLATTSDGPRAGSAPGEPVAAPLDGLRGARGLIAGAPDAGIQDTTATVAGRLLAAGQSVLFVDPESTHRDLARDHDVRLVGEDPEMDGRVTPANADRVARTAGEREESVVLDRDAFAPDIDPSESIRAIAETVGESRRGRTSLVFVLVNCHEWLPDAGESPCADALRALGSETTPGIGVVGVTDRPGAVDAQFRRECDWIAAHRVNWREHVDAVSRILGRGYEDALESLDDGEAFLGGPWFEAVERVRFDDPDRNGGATTRRNATRATGGGARRRSTRDQATEAGGDVAALTAEVTELRDRIGELETVITDHADVIAVAEELADAIADRLDARAGAATDAEPSSQEPARTTDTGDGRSTSRDGESAVSNSAGGFGTVFDAFDDAAGDTASGSTSPASDPATASASSTSERQPPRNTSNGGDDTGGGMAFEPMDFAFDEGASGGTAGPDGVSSRRSGETAGDRRVQRYVRDLVRAVEEMDPTTRKMLAHYVDRGADTPLNAHFSAGGDGDRTAAYAHNRQLRTTGFVEHVGRGHYAPAIPEKVRTAADRDLSADDVSRAAEHVRRALPSAPRK